MAMRIITTADHSFEWIDFHQPTREELSEIAERFNLHPASLNDSMQPDHLPKFETINKVHFIILRLHDDKKVANATTIQHLSTKIAIFFTDKFFITIHRNSARIVNELENDYLYSGKCSTPSELAAKAIKVVLSTFRFPQEQIGKEIDFYESKIFLKKRVPDVLKSLYYLKRHSAVCERIIYLSNAVINEMDAQDKVKKHVIHDLKDEYLNYWTGFVQLNDKLNVLLNIYLGVSSQRTNEVMRVLTAFSAIFLPLSFIAGIYGMNFQYMPELLLKWGYFAALGLMLLVTLVVLQWFKRKGWF